MPQVTLKIEQIINLCKFAGIKVDESNSVFTDDPDQMETEFEIAQNEYGAVAWLTDYPEEGVYPLSNHAEQLENVVRQRG